MKKLRYKLGNLFLIVSLLILTAWSGYYAFKEWQAYQYHKKIIKDLSNVKFLQSLEHAVFNEMVCNVTMNAHTQNFKKICKQMENTTDTILSQIKKGDFDPDIYALKNNVDQIRTEMKTHHNAAITLIKSGKPEAQIHRYIRRHLAKIKQNFKEKEDRKVLELYARLLDDSFAFETEKVLLSHYLSTKKPMDSEMMILWDKLVNSGQDDLGDLKNDTEYFSNIYHAWNSKKVQNTLRQIESVRLDVMDHVTDGRYQTPLVEWIRVSNEKQRILMHIEDNLIDTFIQKLQKQAKENLVKAIAYALVSLLSLIAFLILLGRIASQTRERKRFEQLTAKIKQLSGKTAQSANLLNTDVGYSYIENSYEELYTQTQKMKDELEKKNRFFSNLFYELKLPIESIAGHTSLMRGTELDKEQGVRFEEIDLQSERLKQLYGDFKKGETGNVGNQEESFNLLEKTERSVEHFVPVVAQRDMHLSLFTDPSLNRYVHANASKIYGVLEHLIDDAIRRSKSYGNIDISVKKSHEDNHSVSAIYTVTATNAPLQRNDIEKISNILSLGNRIEVLDIEDQILAIANKKLNELDSQLNFEKHEPNGLNFSFEMRFLKDNEKESPTLVQFEGMKIGIALPSSEISRQQEKNIEAYANALGAECQIYDYDILKDTQARDLSFPDIMIVYHHYARLKGELEMFKDLPCKIALVTTPLLRRRSSVNKLGYTTVVYEPITYHKMIAMLNVAKEKSDEKHEVVSLNDDPVNIESDIIPVVEEEDRNEIQAMNEVRILLAEDNETKQKLWEEKLHNLGIEHITIASDAKEVYEQRTKGEFDLILMDVDIPIMDGFETTNKILYFERVNQLAHVPIVALSSNISKKEEYIKYGMDDVVSKSVSTRELAGIIEKYGIEWALVRSKEEEDELINKMLSGELFD